MQGLLPHSEQERVSHGGRSEWFRIFLVGHVAVTNIPAAVWPELRGCNLKGTYLSRKFCTQSPCHEKGGREDLGRLWLVHIFVRQYAAISHESHVMGLRQHDHVTCFTCQVHVARPQRHLQTHKKKTVCTGVKWFPC